ncbi:MAG: RES family NAD+ phosphorylase [Chthoniobacterales bacterium]
MKVRANPASAKFRRALASHPELLRPWKGTGYRVTSLDYPRPENILSGEGSFLFGGRWNAAGSFRAVYGSTTDTVAVAESRANAEYAGMPYPFRAPRLLIAIEFDLKKVLDLAAEETRVVLDLKWHELEEEDWRRVQAAEVESQTQGLGRALFEMGANGLLAPSARVREGINIAYFPRSGENPEAARICEPAKLDRIRARRE